MNDYKTKTLETMIKGWTRIDMLLALYDRTIATVRGMQASQDDAAAFALKSLEFNRCMLTLQSGLNTEEYPLAVDVARLLGFVALRVEEQNYDEAVHFLEKLHSSFAQIRQEATELEKQGKIPSLTASAGIDTVA